jgi:hypothetical protein
MWTGEIELYVDGKSVISVSGLILRDQEGADARIKGMHFETFFGGTVTSYRLVSQAFLMQFSQAIHPIGHPQKTRKPGSRIFQRRLSINWRVFELVTSRLRNVVHLQLTSHSIPIHDAQ